MGKLQAAVIFGGQSSEHIVSCMSAVNVIEHIDRTRYDVLLVGITEDGHWIKADSLEDVKNGTWRDKTVSALLLPDATKKCILLMDGDSVREVRVDVVFPVLHGCTGRTVPSRGFWNWLRFPMWDAGFFLPQCPWINCTPRLSWMTWESARQHTRQCTGNSLCIWNRWWNGWRSIFPIPYLLSRPMQAPPGA